MYKGYQEEEDTEELFGKYRPIQFNKYERDIKSQRDRRRKFDMDDDYA